MTSWFRDMNHQLTAKSTFASQSDEAVRVAIRRSKRIISTKIVAGRFQNICEGVSNVNTRPPGFLAIPRPPKAYPYSEQVLKGAPASPDAGPASRNISAGEDWRAREPQHPGPPSVRQPLSFGMRGRADRRSQRYLCWLTDGGGGSRKSSQPLPSAATVSP